MHRDTDSSGDSSTLTSGTSSPRCGPVDPEKQDDGHGADRERSATNLPAGYAAATGPCPLQCQDDFGTRSARLFPGVEIKQSDNGRKKSQVFVVGHDPDSVDTDPRKWPLRLRLWAT